VVLNLLEPIVPHIASELSEMLFGRANLGAINIPKEVFVTESIALAVTVNGKKRAEISVAADANSQTIISAARAACEKWLDGKSVIKEIYVPNKLVNFVIKG